MVSTGYKLLVDEDKIVLEINTIPSKSKYFTFTQTAEEGNKEDVLVFMTFNCVNKSRDIITFQWCYLLLFYLWKIAYHRKTKYFVDVDRPDIIPVPSYEASRTLEQGLMAYYHTKNAYNKVNGIAKSNTKYNKYAMAYGEAIIDYSTNQLEEEYLEMIEIGEILKDPTEWY